MHESQAPEDSEIQVMKPTEMEKVIAHKVLLAYDFVCADGGRADRHMEQNIAHGENRIAGMHEARWVHERMAEIMTVEEKESLFGHLVLNILSPTAFWNDLMILCNKVIGYKGPDSQSKHATEWRELLIMHDPLLYALHAMNKRRLIELFSNLPK